MAHPGVETERIRERLVQGGAEIVGALVVAGGLDRLVDAKHDGEHARSKRRYVDGCDLHRRTGEVGGAGGGVAGVVGAAGLGSAGVDRAGSGLEQGAGLAALIALVTLERGNPAAVGIQPLDCIIQFLR